MTAHDREKKFSFELYRGTEEWCRAFIQAVGALLNSEIVAVSIEIIDAAMPEVQPDAE